MTINCTPLSSSRPLRSSAFIMISLPAPPHQFLWITFFDLFVEVVLRYTAFITVARDPECVPMDIKLIDLDPASAPRDPARSMDQNLQQL
ncbi:MAG: hypothetical protein U5J83_08745 [Bryobacterales bacterium]|nr:hypothetical protein [Bryobacterales bacterium]